jgi:hypothetical protein
MKVHSNCTAYPHVASITIVRPADPTVEGKGMWRKVQWLRPAIATIRRSSTTLATRQQSLKHLIKPFLLRCHPDVQQEEASKKLNLVAIQNLNSYLDLVSEALKSGKAPRSLGENNVVLIDFIINVEGPSGRRKKPSESFPSRRQVELVMPTLFRENTGLATPETDFYRKAARELVKLLRVAALPVPSLQAHLSIEDEADGDSYQRPHNHRFNSVPPHRNSPGAKYRANRERFTSAINWREYEKVYLAAVADMHADRMTSGLVRNHAGRRRRLIANILSQAECDDSIDLTDQLVAFRRLSLLLDEHFDKLQLEDLGAYWESCRLELSSARDFAFTLHPDNTVTIRIPVDFTDEQLIRELDRNLWDFVDVVEDDSFSGIFPGT